MKVKPQTNLWYAANKLLMLAMTFLLTVAPTHLIIGEPSVSHKHVNFLSEVAQKFILMAEKESDNLAMFPVHPGLIFSMDDNTMFVFEGTATSVSHKWILYKKDSKCSRRSMILNKPGGTDHLNGLRVRLTHTMNGLGQMAPIYVTVYGLNKR